MGERCGCGGEGRNNWRREGFFNGPGRGIKEMRKILERRWRLYG